MALIFDVEGDGFLYDLTKIHCIVAINTDSGGLHIYADDTKKLKIPYEVTGTVLEGVDYLARYEGTLVGHNITGYDIPAIQKLYPLGTEGLGKDTFDTFIASCILFPENTGHSLEYWAEQLKLTIPKVANEDWSVLTENMLYRCINDVGINERLYKHLTGSCLYGDFEKVLHLESSINRIQSQQEQHGVYYDLKHASDTLKFFDERIELLTNEITKGIPPKVYIHGHSKVLSDSVRAEGGHRHYDSGALPFKKGGGLKANVISYLGEDLCEEMEFINEEGRLETRPKVGPHSRVKFEYLNLNSHPQVKDYLLSIGWKPKEWNFNVNPLTGKKERGSPKLTEESYKSLPTGLGSKIAELYVLKHRRRTILNEKDPTKGSLTTVRSDCRVPAEAMTCATPTSRYRHQKSICNIPRPSSQYGQEIRQLYCVPEDRWMLGVDLSGIEARMMCHYVLLVAESTGDKDKVEAAKKMVDIVINGDFHQFNADTWDVDRNSAKSGLYALMYGCGEAKLASTLGKPVGEGKKLMDSFWTANAPLKDVITALEGAYYDRGYINGLDGRQIQIRDTRKLLNSLLQSGAAVVFKSWMEEVDIYCDSWNAIDVGKDIHQVIAYHDELQFESYNPNKNVAEQHGRSICGLAEKIGTNLNIKVPIKAEFKVGKSWKETH